MHRLLRCGADSTPAGGRVTVIEVNQPDKAAHRRAGKTDILDAESAARAVLSGRATGSAKAGGGPVEMLRMFKLAKASAVKAVPRRSTNSKSCSWQPTPRCARPSRV